MIVCNFAKFLVFVRVFVMSLPTNNTGLMVSSYSKVSHWNPGGALNNTFVNEGRSNRGQLFYTQRTDAVVRSGQNLRNKNSPKRMNNNGRYETLPGVGEVQERFNPRPYFDYAPDAPKMKDNPSYSYDKPFDSFPTFNPPMKSESEKPANTYGSPYTSYNPPPSGETSDKKKPSKDVDDSFRPTVNYEENVEYDTHPPSPSYEDQDEKPKKPEETFMKYPYDDAGPPTTQTTNPPESADFSYLDHPPKEYEHYEPKPAADMDMDLNPPPPNDFDKYPESYPNNFHGDAFDFDHHHHVYHEITTTTTAAPEEHQRVNKGHYSYYYLGRKLWYIPLYFSVYFIVYITILILKSIARHKVSFVQHFDDKRTSRNLDINEMEREVNNAVYTSSKKYMM